MWKIFLGASLAAAAWGEPSVRWCPSADRPRPGAGCERAEFSISRISPRIAIEVMSLANNTVQTSINVAAQPSALALSPDDRYLVVAHFGNAAPPASSSNAMTVIDLTSNGSRPFRSGSAPLGVAFGIDGLALVVTSTDFLLLDPASGTTEELDTIAGRHSRLCRSLPPPFRPAS